MATYIGSAGGVDTATMPSHQAGDLIIAMGFRDGSTTAPALPSGQNWTNLINGGANACSQRVAYKIATSSSEAVGTFTNANAVVVAVYRPGSGETLSVGASAQAGANSATLTWPGLTLTDADGSSWIIGFAGARDPAATIETPFTGMSNRLDYINPTICEAVIHDTTAGVTSWSTGTQSTSGGSSHRAVVVEMIVTASGSSYTLTADSGSFSLTGQAANLRASRRLAADAGAFVLTGQPAALTYTPAGTTYTLTADTGTFSLTGIAAALRASRKLVSAVGAFVLTGQTAGLRASRKLTAAQGSFSLAGQTANLRVSRKIAAGQGSFSLTGQSAGLKVSRKFTLDAGAFTLTGQDAALVYTPAANSYTLTADFGAFTLSGQTAGLRAFRKLTANRGLFALSGQDATLTYSASFEPFVPAGRRVSIAQRNRFVSINARERSVEVGQRSRFIQTAARVRTIDISPRKRAVP